MPACASPGEGRVCATAFRGPVSLRHAAWRATFFSGSRFPLQMAPRFVPQLLLRVTAEIPVKPRGPAPPCMRSRGVWGISCRQSALRCARHCAIYRGGAWLDTVTRGPCTGLARSRWPPCPWPTTSPPMLLQKLVAAGKMGTPTAPQVLPSRHPAWRASRGVGCPRLQRGRDPTSPGGGPSVQGLLGGTRGRQRVHLD